MSRSRSPDLAPMTVPCRQCTGCRLARSREWAVRCVHEASCWPDNVFITLTYSDDYLPDDRSLRHRDWQLFMKRLRKYYGAGVRYYMCGEYGETTGRPHYHAILFNCDFPDKVRKTVRGGHPIYESEMLSKLWPFGFHEIGSVTFESAAYVARYVMKKVTGRAADDYYMRLDEATGEIYNLKPEYCQPSRGRGIGSFWIERFLTDVFPLGYVTLREGVKVSVPRYYSDFFKRVKPADFDEYKADRDYVLYKQRLDAFNSEADKFSQDALISREIVLNSKLSRLVRPLD